MSYSLDLSKLRKAIKVTINCDKDGKACELVASLTLKDTSTGKSKTFVRKVPLGDLINAIEARINAMTGGHQGQLPVGGQWEDQRSVMKGWTIAAGWLADTYHRAAQIAKRVAEDKAVKALYEDVLPEVAPFIPGAETAISIAHKAHDVLVHARAGEQWAIHKVHQLQGMASAGSDEAHQVLGMMSAMSKLLRMKEGYEHQREDMSGWAYNKPYRDNLTAFALDKSDPFVAARYLYNRGLGR